MIRLALGGLVVGVLTITAGAALILSEPIGYTSTAGFARPRGPLAPTPEWLALATPVAAIAYETGWRGDALVRRVAVVGAESNFDPNALGDNYPIRGLLCPSHGWNQIRSCPGTRGGLDRGPRVALVDPRTNMQVAWRLEHSLLGMLHWSTWTNQRFRAYLPIAEKATEGYR